MIDNLRNEFEILIGFSQDIPQSTLLAMANAHVMNIADFGKYATEHGVKTDSFPWAQYGLSKDEYASAAVIFGTEYKKVTGQDISQSALADAFRNPRDPTGSQILTGSQYQQQLMQDAAIQKTYGWVKYGMDYSAWTAQKLQSRTAFGRDINDAEAATLLQYNVSNKGSNMAVTAKQAGGGQQQQPAGVGGSVVR